MQRGATTLFSNIFEQTTPIPDSGKSLRQQKVECIIDFYYYAGRKTGSSYPKLLELCSELFFLSSITLHDIMQKNVDDLLIIKQQWKDVKVEKLQKQMELKWPYINWHVL